MKHLSLILGAVAYLAMGSTAALAQGNGAVSMKNDATYYVYNECCGELIEITGTLHQVMNTKTGKSHTNFQNMTATGESGNTYTGNWVSNNTFVENEDGTLEGSTHIKVQLTSPDGCSFTAHILYTWTYDPVTFEYSEDVKKYEIECEGDLS